MAMRNSIQLAGVEVRLGTRAEDNREEGGDDGGINLIGLPNLTHPEKSRAA